MDLSGKRVVVMGLGRFGGGLGVAQWLCAEGAEVLLTDLDSGERLTKPIASLSSLIDQGRITLRLGGHNISDFTTCDLVVANPAVPKPWDNRFLRAARAAAIPITTEIRLLVERLPTRERTIAVTGTAGKSTTASMIHHILRRSGLTAHLGGNIGGSLLSQLQHITPQDWVVLELSSAMLHWLDAGAGHGADPPWAPHIAVVTSFAPNHLDWHANAAHYERSKQVILRAQGPHAAAVLHESAWRWIEGPHAIPLPGAAYEEVCDNDALPVGSIPLPGRHNRVNAAIAVEACAMAGIDHDSALRALADFTGLPHRLEPVAAPRGLRAFNDSKSTTPEATALAIAAFSEPGEVGPEHLHLICGGYDKQIDLQPMVIPASQCACVYAIGATGDRITAAIREAGGRAEFCETLESATSQAIKKAAPGDLLLLSPGCASWDQFTNYEERGDRFRVLLGG